MLSPDAPRQKPRILFVDDEPILLEMVARGLRRDFSITTASGARAALEKMGAESFHAVVSDLRMPGMDGVQLLGKVRETHPDCIRILMSGDADVESAIAAVNQGCVFRLLCKPCSQPDLLRALNAAVDQYDLVCAERELLERTLRGTVQALTDVLSATNPVAFGHASKIRNVAATAARAMGIRDVWAIEVAVVFEQLAMVTVSAETIERMIAGEELTDEENAAIARGPALVERLFSRIPRLDRAHAIAAAAAGDGLRVAPDIAREAQIVRTVNEFHRLQVRGMASEAIVARLRSRGADPIVLEALANLYGFGSRPYELVQVPLHALVAGMVLAQELRNDKGLLLARSGFEVNETFAARATSLCRSAAGSTIRVYAPCER